MQVNNLKFTLKTFYKKITKDHTIIQITKLWKLTFAGVNFERPSDNERNNTKYLKL